MYYALRIIIHIGSLATMYMYINGVVMCAYGNTINYTIIYWPPINLNIIIFYYFVERPDICVEEPWYGLQLLP